MIHTLSTGVIIGASLCRNNGQLTFEELHKVALTIMKSKPGYYIDISRDSVIVETGFNKSLFKLSNGGICLSDTSQNTLNRAKALCYDILDNNICSAIDEALEV